MEDGNQNADEEAYKNAEEVLKANGIAGKMVARMLKSLKAKGRQGGQFIDALVIMGEATKQSELAEKAYWDYSKNSVLTSSFKKRDFSSSSLCLSAHSFSIVS